MYSLWGTDVSGKYEGGKTLLQVFRPVTTFDGMLALIHGKLLAEYGKKPIKLMARLTISGREKLLQTITSNDDLEFLFDEYESGVVRMVQIFVEVGQMDESQGEPIAGAVTTHDSNGLRVEFSQHAVGNSSGPKSDGISQDPEMRRR